MLSVCVLLCVLLGHTKHGLVPAIDSVCLKLFLLDKKKKKT